MKIAIISHTEHYTKKDGTVVGWGSTIKEINHLTEIVDKITHIAPLHSIKPPLSSLPYNSTSIEFVPLKPSGGKFLKKLSILYTAPYNLIKIHKAIKNADYVQFRAPTGMGIYVLPYLKFINSKKYWVKYAGNWKDEQMPLGNKVQKIWLQKCLPLKNKVTVNGNWQSEKKNVLPFNNPCLDENDRLLGKDSTKNKDLSNKINFCFVGALNNHKGVDKIINAFLKINNDLIGTIHFAGDGVLKEKYTSLANNIKYKVIFHGALPKNELTEIYRQSHFILLPSKSEGFPKVIGEAMNFGCIPIVSEVSCINQYITDKENGFLISPLSEQQIQTKIEEALLLTEKSFFEIINKNYDKASIFTYKYYNNQLLKKVFI